MNDKTDIPWCTCGNTLGNICCPTHSPLSEEDAEMLDIPSDKPEAEPDDDDCVGLSRDPQTKEEIDQLLKDVEEPEAEPLMEGRLETFFKRQDRRDQPPTRIWCGDCGSVAVKNGNSWFAIHHADYCLLTTIRALQAQMAELEAECHHLKFGKYGIQDLSARRMKGQTIRAELEAELIQANDALAEVRKALGEWNRRFACEGVEALKAKAAELKAESEIRFKRMEFEAEQHAKVCVERDDIQTENRRLRESNTQLRNTLLRVTEDRLAAHAEIVRLNGILERNSPKIGKADKMLREAGYNPPWNSPVTYALTILARDKNIRSLDKSRLRWIRYAKRLEDALGGPVTAFLAIHSKKAALVGEKTDNKEDPSRILNRLAYAKMTELNLSYAQAAGQILKDNPKLAKTYRDYVLKANTREKTDG